MLAADVVVMAAVMVVNVVVGIVKPLYTFGHIYVYIIKLSNRPCVHAEVLLFGRVLSVLAIDHLVSGCVSLQPRPHSYTC